MNHINTATMQKSTGHKWHAFAVRTVLFSVLSSATAATLATAQTLPEPQNVVSLSVTSSKEVTQDYLTMVLSTTKEHSDANEVQRQLKQAVDAAIAVVKPAVEKSKLELESGAFSLYPRYSKDGKINAWQGTAELIVHGKDFDRITRSVGKVQTLTISRLGFSLSSEARMQHEQLLQSTAIEEFKAKATQIAKSFGMSSFTVRDVSVGTQDAAPVAMSARLQSSKGASFSADVAPSVEAGSAQVSVTVSGSVQLK